MGSEHNALLSIDCLRGLLLSALRYRIAVGRLKLAPCPTMREQQTNADDLARLAKLRGMVRRAIDHRSALDIEKI